MLLQRPGVLFLPGTPEMHRHLWRCVSSCRHIQGWFTAAAESPPPMIVTASVSASASATALVPAAKVRHFEAAHRSVPYNCLSIFNSISEQFCCFRSDIQTFPSIRNLSGRNNLCICSRLRMHLQQRCLPEEAVSRLLLLLFLSSFVCIIQIIHLKQRITNGAACCFCEGISHTTADDQDINFIDQVVDNRNLAGYFGSTKDGNKRTLRIVDSISKEMRSLSPSGNQQQQCQHIW